MDCIEYIIHELESQRRDDDIQEVDAARVESETAVDIDTGFAEDG